MLSSILSIVWILLPVAAWLLNLCTGRRIHGLLLLLVTALAGYLLLLGTVAIVNAELDAEIERYDLDGDGGYSEDELTPAAQQALDEWASDTGRQFAPIVGIPLTAIWYTIVLGILYVGHWITVRLMFPLKSRTTPESEQTGRSQLVDRPPEDGNPYRATRVGNDEI